MCANGMYYALSFLSAINLEFNGIIWSLLLLN